MDWRLVVATCALVAVGGVSQEVGPSFSVEPPARLVVGGRGGAAHCAARGSPPPLVTWHHADMAPLQHAPALRQVLENGTLLFLPFSPEQYRGEVHAALYRCRAHNALGALLSREMRVQAGQYYTITSDRLQCSCISPEQYRGEVHAALYRCRAHNALGALLSREMRVQAVVEAEWSARAVSSRAALGGPALLACLVAGGERARASVAAWYRDDVVLVSSESILIVDEGWRLVVRRVHAEDARAAFSCSVLDALTGDRRRSSAATIQLTPSAEASAPRGVTQEPWQVTARQGSDVTLPCLVESNPAPIITWYRETPSGVLRELRDSDGGGRYQRGGDTVSIRRVVGADAGRWACRATNALGHVTLRLQLDVYADLTAYIHPQIQVVNSGGTATMNCSWSGLPAPRVEWFHNASPIGTGLSGRVRVSGEQLTVRAVQRSDRGVYQCVLRNERDSAQASALLKLGDTPPELQYTFIEQVLRAGQLVTLKCSASGTPPPHFTWLLDAQPLNTMARGHRYSVEQFATKSGEVVGYLNITAVRSEDGGLYTCKATNNLGEVEHTSRLNIYGPPYIRAIGPIRAVAGRELTLYCPYSGYPISGVKWEREGRTVEGEAGAGGAEGALVLRRVQASHAGAYSCSVTGAQGGLARRDLQLVVSNPPEIEPFAFSANLQEGKRAQVSCSVTSGDMPVHFGWLKDNGPIPSSLQVEERGADFFSNLVFKEVSAHHSGFYTCIASNAAAKVNYTAELVVKVSPKWILEPVDTSVLAGEQLTLHCDTTGAPQPQVVWLKQRGQSSDLIPLSELGGRFQTFPNGTLAVDSVLPYDEGHYMCRAENAVGAPISKTVLVSVNEAARFEAGAQNVSGVRGEPLTLSCSARGDRPLRLRWTHDGTALPPSSYRVSVSEAATERGLRSQLAVTRAERRDAGVYRCEASNAHGRADHFIYVSVREKAETPHSLAVTELSSRAVRLTWTQGFDGNAPILRYTIQVAPLPPQGAPHELSWQGAALYNVSLSAPYGDSSNVVSLSQAGGGQYSARVGALRPHSAYAARVAAGNAVGDSAYTEPVVFKTQEEAPGSPGSDLSATPLAGGALAVRWSPAPRDSWHGDLLGYQLTVRPLPNAHSEILDYNDTRTITVPGWASTSVTVSGLRRAARYELRLRAYNRAAASRPSPPVTVTTLEGVPESPPQHVSCAALSSSSLQVSWAPPPAHHHAGLILGYKVIYAPLTTDYGAGVEVKRVPAGAGGGGGEGTQATLSALRRFTNYSLQALAYTAAGDGARSAPLYCRTRDDVPSSPAKIKLTPLSSDSVLVSWLPPEHPNGIITHYTVYYREIGRSGKQSSYTVPSEEGALESVFEVRAGGSAGAGAGGALELWVTASTARGEGPPSQLVTHQPTPQTAGGARVASVGGGVRARGGQALRLSCWVVGGAARWRLASRPAAPLGPPLYSLEPPSHLRIHEVSEQTAGNYTCTAGAESVWWHVVMLRPPSAPVLQLHYATPNSLKVHWQTPSDGGAPILGYTVEVRRDGGEERGGAEWSRAAWPGDAAGALLEGLRCGSPHAVRAAAHSALGASPPSTTLRAHTRGGAPKAPKPEDLFTQNSTAVQINLFEWKDNGCPILGYHVSYRRAEAEHWIQVVDNLNAASHVLSGLMPGSWYEVSVSATNDAGTEKIDAFIDTLTATGGRVPPLKVSPSVSGAGAGAAGGVGAGARGVLAACVSGAVLAASLLAAAVLLTRRDRHCCGGGAARKLSDSGGEAGEREGLRAHKLYSSSSINGNDKSNDDSSEVYEISPYATFGGAADGEGEGEAALPLHYRSLRRAPPALACDHYSFEESSLSASSTVEVRGRARASRARSPRGSGCERDADIDDDARSHSHSYQPHPHPHSHGHPHSHYKEARSRSSGGRRRGASRSDDEVLTPTCFKPAPTDISTLIDKYQQRKEQERRECTIHV